MRFKWSWASLASGRFLRLFTQSCSFSRRFSRRIADFDFLSSEMMSSWTGASPPSTRAGLHLAISVSGACPLHGVIDNILITRLWGGV